LMSTVSGADAQVTRGASTDFKQFFFFFFFVLSSPNWNLC
jgi:hypothetical protein